MTEATISAPATDAGSAAPSSGAAPVTSSAPAAQSAPTTAAPATSSATVPVPVTGEPPKERWNDILANTRTKTRAEVEQEFKQKYGWAEEYQTDRWSFVQRQLAELANHPQYAPFVAQTAARILQAQRARNGPTIEEPKPDVPIVDQSGQVTGYTYSSDRLKEWHRWNQQSTDAKLSERLRPLEAMREQQEQTRAVLALREQADTQAADTLTTLRTNPYFTEHEAKVKQALIDHEEFGDNVHAAFNHVLTTEILPGLSRTEQQKVLTSLQTQAAGGSVNPGQTAPSHAPTFRTGNFSRDAEAALRYFAEHPEEAETAAKR